MERAAMSEQSRSFDILTDVRRIMAGLDDQDPIPSEADMFEQCRSLPQAHLEALWIWVQARRNNDPEAWLEQWQAMREQLLGEWLIQMDQAFAQGSGEAVGEGCPSKVCTLEPGAPETARRSQTTTRDQAVSPTKVAQDAGNRPLAGLTVFPKRMPLARSRPARI
jgi:hypothetical protein